MKNKKKMLCFPKFSKTQQKEGASIMAYKMKMKKASKLKGGQKKLDANKDGKIGKQDFAMLRNKKKKVMA